MGADRTVEDARRSTDPSNHVALATEPEQHPAVDSLEVTAPAFVDIAHRIVWATVATADAEGRPRTRILHPIWEWDGSSLVGWIATGPTPVKVRDLDAHPDVSLTYWDPTQDTASAECRATWHHDDETCTWLWDRFRDAPAPVGYDPAIIPPWTSPEARDFGVLRLAPTRLRVMPGTVMLQGQGEVLTWRA